VKPNEQAKRLLDLQTILIQFLEIDRKVFVPDGKLTDRFENDVEHSFNLAMLGWYLSQVYPSLDKNLIIQFALIHDLVEVYAGDIMAIGRTEEEQKNKDLAEKEALINLQKQWPDFSDMTNMIEKYEEQKLPEAVFVKSLDKLAPLLLQILSKGKTWKHHDMSRNDIIKHKDEKTKNSPEINEIWIELKKIVLEHDEYFNEGRTN
jgi:putative hydrolase of HD superfamily